MSENQRIGTCGRRWCTVSATVEDSEALRWWMLSFGVSLRVLAPKPLFDELRERTRAMAALYARSPGKVKVRVSSDTQ
ncbi:WYL domain-containing protein [Acidithiobacillus sp. M4-SHS-6]|uniref:WYL domain-containing protein n=1 Tax=Acidithiobacillus sp. M4-SHS-6 TaxID=3383024 RepID=UPI0039BE9FBB